MTPEEAVIGACLLDQNVIREAVQHVMPSDFSFWKGVEIFQAIVDLHAMHEPVDAITVATKLAQSGSKVHPAELHSIIERTPTAANVGFYAAQVREDAVRRALRVAATRLAQEAENDMVPSGIALSQGLSALKAIRDDAPGTGIHHRTLGEVMAEADSYDWVIRNLLERGDRLMMTGSEGVGKSILNRQMAIFAAAGIHPFWLTDIPPVNVIVVDRENSERQWRRKSRTMWEQARRFGSRDPSNLVLSCDTRSMDITRDTDLGNIHRLLDENPCDLLFIGPVYKLVPRAIQTDDEAAPLLAALDTLRDRGCAMVMEAHSGHQRQVDLRPVGSSAFLRWPEFGRGLRKDMAIPGRVTFEQWRGDRDERSFPDALTRGGAVPWTAEGVSPAMSARFASGQNQRTFYEPEHEMEPENGF